MNQFVCQAQPTLQVKQPRPQSIGGEALVVAQQRAHVVVLGHNPSFQVSRPKYPSRSRILAKRFQSWVRVLDEFERLRMKIHDIFEAP